MRDLISRGDAIKAVLVSNFSACTVFGRSEEGMATAKELIQVIKNLPSVQPEIIRCKDCKHQVKEWREDGRFKDNGYWVHGCEIISDICGYWALFGHNDQFCSEAERRNDG